MFIDAPVGKGEYSMSMNCAQLAEEIIRPPLQSMSLWSQSAEDLLLGTAAVESNLGTYVKQIKGPALGIFQMEPATHLDIWTNFLQYKKGEPMYLIAHKLAPLKLSVDDIGEIPHEHNLVFNMWYAAALTRIYYLRVPEALPQKEDFASDLAYITALGEYWKKYYNTEKGKGTVDNFIVSWSNCGVAHR